MIVNINAHLGHFLLLDIYKFALFFSLQVSKDVDFLSSRHCFNIIDRYLRRSKWHISYLRVEST